MHNNFRGIWVPIVTPFTPGDTRHIDHLALRRLAQSLQAAGIHGLVAAATTGEGALLLAGEQEAIFQTLREAVPGLPVVLGVSSAATAQACTQARELAALRPEGLLVTPPTYVRPTQGGVRAHFEAVAQAADLPLLIYNIPYRTGVAVELETLQALQTDARIAGIKECGATPERMQRLIDETRLRILCGDDSQNFSALCQGAHGVISASAHVRPEWHVRMFDWLQSGNGLVEARRLARALAPLTRSLFAEPNPAPLKAWLAQQGHCSAELRLPFQTASAGLQQRIAEQYARL